MILESSAFQSARKTYGLVKGNLPHIKKFRRGLRELPKMQESLARSSAQPKPSITSALSTLWGGGMGIRISRSSSAIQPKLGETLS